MNRVCTWITIAYFIVAVFAGSDLEQGYYWREFKQEIPKDAFVAVVGKDGKNNYIGRTTYPDPSAKYGRYCRLLILPGIIRQGETEMQYEFKSERHVTEENVEILCTHHPQDFEWLEIENTIRINWRDIHLVSGGEVYPFPNIFIGRVTSEKEALIGRAINVGDETEAFYSATSTATFSTDMNFEVLAYNPRK